LLFTEPTFLFLFLPVLLALYFATLSREHREYGNVLLLIASVIFYAKGGGSFTWLMLASITFNYLMGIAVDRARAGGGGASRAPKRDRAKAVLFFAVAVNLIVLGIFKYANFFADNVNTLFLALGIDPVVVPRVLLPIGISFYTFHAISYVVDVYRCDAIAQKSPVHAALYLLLFPQLIAGPIIRYRDLADQLARRIVTVGDFAYGVRRFVIGLGKKVLIANVVAGPADAIFAMPFAELSAGHAWLALVCYTVQIYFDFSGYSDMAIGLGRMFGFRFPENFRWPYIARSVQEFWRRWHISLSTWFRDYLYKPLGGNRVSPAMMYTNLVTVFFLCGLWHGASWNFVIWGLWHGAFLVIERVLATGRHENTKTKNTKTENTKSENTKGLYLESQDSFSWFRVFVLSWKHIYTLAVVMIGWVFFRAETLAGALAFLKAMAGLSSAAPAPLTVQWFLSNDVMLAIAAGVLGSTPWLPVLAARREPDRTESPLTPAGALGLTAVFVLSIMHVAARSYNPFIYFRF
jgi:alginate O-acetyltransferase complex protein AlgI